MNILEALLLYSILILFPLFCYFLFVINEQNVGKKTSDILFELALLSSFYLIFKYDIRYGSIMVMFVTVPLLIAYLRNKKWSVLIFSIVIGLYYYYKLDINIMYIILEFIMYFAFVFFLRKKGESDNTIIATFVIIKIVFTALELNQVLINNFDTLKEIIILPFVFYFMTYLICFLIIQSEKIMSLHMTIKELEKEKQLRDSLFKITHEIKNPIAVCKGYLDMFDPNNEDHIKRYIPIVRQEIERTLTLMNDFMNLTKLVVDKRRMDISVLLQDISEILSMMLKEKKIKYESSIIDEEVYIEGDYDRLKQVFVNMIKNAIEAIPADKKGLIKFDTKAVRNKVIINITDNGIGMSEEICNRIGEAFYTTKSNGTGLGVKLSKEIIGAHEGTIEYKSKPKVGTTVIITLPLKKSL